LPKSQGGLGGAVLFIDTEIPSQNQKLKALLEYLVYLSEVLGDIYHARIYSTSF
jgi:hypothetical protein